MHIPSDPRQITTCFDKLSNHEGRSEVTIVLRRKSRHAKASSEITRLSRVQFVELHGANEDDLALVYQYADRFGLAVSDFHKSGRTVKLSGCREALQAAFAGQSRSPADLERAVVAVLGLTRQRACDTKQAQDNQAVAKSSFTPRELGRIYKFPPNTGKGQTIALIELGGGYKQEDLLQYWNKLGLPAVKVVAVSVDGAANNPTGDANGPDGEVVLDINVAGALAPAATIVVYFAPNTDAGFLNSINAAIHDPVHKPSVISISWGAAEKEWDAATMNAFNAAFQDAASLGITVCAAAGDNGSSDGEADKGDHVDFPASSPWVLACGGTRLVAAKQTIQSEAVWNDGTHGGATGGGVSAFFDKPDYQKDLPQSIGKRGVPDVAAVADPQTGYEVFVDGQSCVVGGTSAVAPLWASLIALCNESIGKPVGFIHPHLYGTFAQAKALHDVRTGTNGAYKAGPGWDSCTGLGSPDGQAILAALRSIKPAK